LLLCNKASITERYCAATARTLAFLLSQIFWEKNQSTTCIASQTVACMSR